MTTRNSQLNNCIKKLCEREECNRGERDARVRGKGGKSRNQNNICIARFYYLSEDADANRCERNGEKNLHLQISFLHACFSISITLVGSFKENEFIQRGICVHAGTSICIFCGIISISAKVRANSKREESSEEEKEARRNTRSEGRKRGEAEERNANAKDRQGPERKEGAENEGELRSASESPGASRSALSRWMSSGQYGFLSFSLSLVV